VPARPIHRDIAVRPMTAVGETFVSGATFFRRASRLSFKHKHNL
jgi:hypothetical protein